MTIVDLLICALAVWHAVEVWHHGSIFATARKYLENRLDGIVPQLLLCPFCLSLHTAAIITTWYSLAQLLEYPHLWQLPVLILAICRLANIGNDVFYNWSRTPAR